MLGPPNPALSLSGHTSNSCPNGQPALVAVPSCETNVPAQCDLNSGIAGYPMLLGENILCYYRRLFEVFAAGGDLTSYLTKSANLSDLFDSAAARSNLGLGSVLGDISSLQAALAGLGTMSAQNSNSVSITGGTITGITDLAVADGGTGISTVPTNGQLLVGNGTGYSLANLVEGARITITNGPGTITISADQAAAVTTSSAPPVNPDNGDLWWDDLNGQLKIWYDDGDSAQWVDASGGGGEASGVASVSADAPLSSSGGNSPTISLSGVVAVANGGTGSATPSVARTNLGLGSISTQNSNSVAISGGTITGITDLAVADGGTGASDAAGARTNLGLGSVSTQAANNVSITGGSITGITDLAVADGGTGASDASTARTNLGIGSAAVHDSSYFLQTANNLSDIPSVSIARANLGVSSSSDVLLKANNFSDVGNVNTARANLGLGSLASQDSTLVNITGGSITGITDLAIADGGTGASTAANARTNLGVTATGSDTTYAYRANNLSDLASASTARTNLGLGSMATQNASNVAITGGSVTGITDIAVTDGGTGVSTVPNNGQILIGNGFGYTVANLTAGANVSISNSAGGITISASGGGGGGGSITDVTASAPLSSSGGTVPDISLTGTVLAANGGTGLSSIPTNGQLLVGNGTGYSLANLTAGARISITNGPGAITISADQAAAVTTSSTPPVSPTDGDLWWNDVTGQLKIWYDDGDSAQWVDAAGAGGEGSGVASVTANYPLYSSGGLSPSISLGGIVAIANGGTGASTASSARTNLGLGSMSTQNSNSVSISGGAISGITDLALADGGTGASDASGARTNLGLGTAAVQNVTYFLQAANNLSDIPSASTARANLGVPSNSDVLLKANNLSDLANASTARTNLGLGSLALQSSAAVSITGGTITGGTITGITDLAVSDGGTGASDAATARTNLGVTATGSDTTYAYRANNLSDLDSAATARTNLGLGSMATQDANSAAITGGTISGITDLAVADGGTGSSTAAGARTNLGVTATGADTTYAYRANNLSDLASATAARNNLGLGSMATQNASNVAITGGTITGITDLAVSDGGTGASTAAAARVNLLPSYSGNNGKVLALNSGGTDTEWISASGDAYTEVITFLKSDGTDNYTYTDTNQDPNRIRLSEVLSGDIPQTGYPITAIALVESGAGYTNGTYSFTLTGGTGSSCAGRVQVANNKVVMLEITNPGSGYRFIPAEIYYTGSEFQLNLGARGIKNDTTAINALLPNGVTVSCPSLFNTGVTLSSKTWDAAAAGGQGRWILTFSASPIGGAGYYNAVFGIPVISASIGSGGGFDYRFFLGNKRSYRIPPGSYRWNGGFSLEGVSNAVIDCTGVVFYSTNKDTSGLVIGDHSTGVELIGLSYANRASDGTLDPLTRGDGMPMTLNGAYNKVKDFTLISGGDWGFRVGGGAQLRTYNAEIEGYRNLSSWGDTLHAGNVTGLRMSNFYVEQSGDDVIALFADALSLSILGLTQPTFVGYVTYVSINSGGSGYTNGTYSNLPAIGGGGSGATVQVTVSGGVITGVSVSNNGSGYTSGPLFDLSSIPGGSGGQVQGQLSWTSISGSLSGTRTNAFRRFGYRTSMFFSDALLRVKVTAAVSDSDNGTISSTLTLVDGGFGYVAQPTLVYSTGGKDVNICNGIVKRGGWRGILVGPWGWENVSISNVVFNGLGGTGIIVGDGDGAETYQSVIPELKGIRLTGLTFNGIGVPEYRANYTRNVAQIYKVNGGMLDLVDSNSDNATIYVQYCSNVRVNAVSSNGAVTYSGTGNTNVQHLTGTTF